MSGLPTQKLNASVDGDLRLSRALFPTIKRGLDSEGCVLLVGPYEVGKSDLAREIAKDFGLGAHVLNGSDEGDQAQLKGESGLVRNSLGKLIIIDEVHSFPESLDLIRAELELARASGQAIGQFLVLGSVTTEAQRLTAVRLGTNASTFRLSTISLAELPNESTPQLATTRTFAATELDRTVPIARANITVPMQTLWIRGGFPRSLFAMDEAASFRWRARYIEMLGARGYQHSNGFLAASTVQRLLLRVALMQGEIFKFDAKPAEEKACLDHLDDVGIIRQLQPWYPHGLKRFEKNPKVYIRDTGLLHCLLKRRSYEEVLSDGMVHGHSWEGFCIENLIEAAPTADAYYYRFEDRDEVDLVLEFGDQRRLAIEFKAGSGRPSDGFKRALEVLKPIDRGYVVKPVSESSDHGYYREMTLRDMLEIVRSVARAG